MRFWVRSPTLKKKVIGRLVWSGLHNGFKLGLEGWEYSSVADSLSANVRPGLDHQNWGEGGLKLGTFILFLGSTFINGESSHKYAGV